MSTVTDAQIRATEDELARMKQQQAAQASARADSTQAVRTLALRLANIENPNAPVSLAGIQDEAQVDWSLPEAKEWLDYARDVIGESKMLGFTVEEPSDSDT